MTPDMQAIAQRLEELEKQVEHLAALVTEQSDPDRMVSARGFVVKDESGKRRAELGMTTFGGQTEAQPYLAICDPSGLQPRLLFTASTLGLTNVLIYDGNGKLRLNLEVDEAGSPRLVMHDGNAEPRFYIELSPLGHPGLVMRDATGKPFLRLSTDENGPTIGLFDVGGKQEAEVTPGGVLLVAGEKHRVKLGMSSQSEFVAVASGNVSGYGSVSPKEHQNMPLLAFCDEDGRSTNFLILTANGPRLRLQDRQGNEVSLAVEYETGKASISIAGKDGKVWSAP